MTRPKRTRSRPIDRSRPENMRLIRTIILGAIAVTVAIVWMGDQYGIEREETLRYLGTAALFVGLLVGCGLLGLGTLIAARWIRARPKLIPKPSPKKGASVEPERNDPS
ncbi:MAG: hypothetical protein ACI9ON_001372 [Limisphaerales bacterium]|jgi:hypothetical protein